MVINDEKPKGQRRQKPKPKHSFNQRLLMLEREIKKLAKLIRDYRKEYLRPRPKRSQKTKGKSTNQTDKISKST